MSIKTGRICHLKEGGYGYIEHIKERVLFTFDCVDTEEPASLKSLSIGDVVHFTKDPSRLKPIALEVIPIKH